ncbi:hypothetical protein HF086_008467 [Spodoptera exigua]|uniref:Uncharacterized protein n=1 Tax=Spodoptera exigua TaxID=7107 RepID=A0A922MA80_SPOEX|nr:hypothetical protein HF086_008467 [Spodoptera exigua]
MLPATPIICGGETSRWLKSSGCTFIGKVSIANQIIWYEPTSPEHEDLAELARQNVGGRYAHPIYSKEGGWPPTIEKVLEEVSLKRGYPRTQLPPLTEEEIELVKGLRKDLVWLKQQYGDLEFMITENGLSNRGGLDDQDREDGVNVTAYTAWTLMDNFEWMNGYGVKFGLYEVDFTDPERKRTPRASAHYYASIIRTHSLDVPTTQNNV